MDSSREEFPGPSKHVAIIGMAMRLPGHIHNSEDLFTFLSRKKNGLCDVPENRFNIDGFYDPSGGPGTIPVNKAHFLRDTELQQFDTNVFPIPKTELERLDPGQRQLLQVAFECLENAGLSTWRGSRMGCYIGEFGEDWTDLYARETQHRGGYRCTGLGDFALANRLSYELDLRGPSMTVKTACSSSLVGLDIACKAIQSGECDSALVGGVSLIMSPTVYIALNDQGVISPNGQCRTFDASADGYARGEAVNMILVKRLDHALRDNDPIRAIVRGTGVNTDGRTNGMLTPSPTAQATLIRQTYAAAGIEDLSQTAIVECHGTGTSVGDPIEAEAIGQCFGEKGVLITSVKPNLGHSEAAAGLTSLIKCVLALEHQTVLPNINFDKPNPNIPFQKFSLRVPTEVEPWPENRAERVSVNSFGIGGVNAHVILESVRQFGLEPASQLDRMLSNGGATNGTHTNGTHTNGTQTNGTQANGTHTNGIHANGTHSNGIHTNGTNGTHTNGAHANGTHANGTNANGTHVDEIQSNGTQPNGTQANGTQTNGAQTNGTDKPPQPNILFFSAYNADSLKAQIDVYREYTAHRQPQLHDLAYTLANRRQHKPHRAFVVTEDVSVFEDISDTKAIDESPPRVAWIFTGQGAQWPEMGAELLNTNATFRATIRKLDKYLQTFPQPSSLSIEEELCKGKAESRVHSAEVGHPVCAALQIALVDVLRSWGVVPDIIIGHSSGEIAAAYASGAITAEVAMFIATRRGINNLISQRKGSMAAVGLGRDEIQPYLLPGVDIACENSQCNVTLSGDTDALESVIEALQADQVFVRKLRVEKAFHSHHMREHGHGYEIQLKPVVRSVDPQAAFYSTVTGERLTGDGNLEAPYWRANVESAVLFNPALRSALRDEAGKVVLIEIGPHPALGGPIGQILRDIGRSDVHVGTLIRGKSGHRSLLNLAGRLYQQSLPIDLSLICPPGKIVKDLPRYSWKQDTSHWEEPRVSHAWRHRENPPHELLGSRVLEIASEPCWRKVLALEDALWLIGHEVNGQVVFPAAGYIAMVGEALRQLSSIATYSLRNINIVSAMVLEMGKATEIVTSLKPSRTDTSDSSLWYDFTITSYNGTAWVTNCHGEARSSVDNSFCTDTIPFPASFPRKVDEKNWYEVLRRIGFNYTGLFEGITSVSASTISREAQANVAAQIKAATAKESRCSMYALHPAVIDQCFQLFTVAACHGLRRKMTQLAVPTFIEEMIISPSVLDLQVMAKINSLEELGSWTGDLVARGADTPVVSLKGMKTSVLTMNSAGGQDPLITQLEWMPHSDFVDIGTGLHPRAPRLREWPLLEELITLCCYDHLEQIKVGESTPEHLPKFLDWMRLHTERYEAGANVLISKDLGLGTLNHEQRLARIDATLRELSGLLDGVFATAVHRLFSEATNLFSGETHPLHVLLPDNVLSRIYDAASLDCIDAIRLIANTNPHLRVLEVGAGTGGTTSKVLQALTSPYGERLYSLYSYTDVSAGFMTAAKERFAGFENIEYGVLDVSKDPSEQGFQLDSYDLIIGANVLHATPSLNVTLRNVHSLLKPDGRLFLEEVCPDSMFISYIMGYFSGWWLGADDNRVEKPWVSPARWKEELAAVGFQEPDAIVLDSVAPYHLSAGIIVSRSPRTATPPSVAILCHTPDGPYVAELCRHLVDREITFTICLFGQALPACDTISLLDLQEPTLHDMNEETFKTVASYMQSPKENIVWVTRASQVDCEDPRAAMILGLARTVRNETSAKLFTVELDYATTPETATKSITDILCRAQTHCVTSESMDPDYEFAIVEGEILVSRFHWQTVSSAFAGIEDTTAQEDRLKQLTMTTPGLLHTMKWGNGTIKSPAQGEILVETKAVGLNFKDIVIALGIVEGSPSQMGFEGSGIVRAVGPGVQRLSVGDRVMYMGGGCFATHITLSETLCVQMDSSMSFIQGATMPCVYATALMALVDTANLQKGQSILIHAACGGVGLAAIQIAQMIGAKIYCTVGSETKRNYLIDNCSIEPSHIFNSRDSRFLPEIMRITDNVGVDVVLNSLSGDLLQASWKCVAEFGIMLEIGKRDFQRRSKLAMETFEANRAFVGLDLGGLCQSRPERAATLLNRCVELVRSNSVSCLPISDTFPAADIQGAYRTMQAAKHIGKIVIEMPDSPLDLDLDQGAESCSEPLASTPTPTFRPDRSYLLVGGLGGLGQLIATYMVENGARCLVFLSRSAREGPKTQGFVEELRSQGCQVLFVPGSVDVMSDVQQAVDAATAVQPIGGVINLSMVLKDVVFSEMTFSDWTTAVDPKVKGTWNLHHATASSPLDFFLLFSSQNGQIGLRGQANYAAANTFLDAFVQYRHRNGLPSSVIDIGVMGSVGFVARNQNILKSLEKTGMYILQEQNLLDAITLALDNSRPAQPSSHKKLHRSVGQVGLGLNTTTPISSPSTRVSWKVDRRMGIYHNLENSTEASSAGNSSQQSSLKSLLAAEQSEEAITSLIAKHLAAALAKFLIKDEDSFPLDRPLVDVGMDSLIAMELRNWIRQQIGAEISTFIILQSPSLTHLGDSIRMAMASKSES